MGTEVKSSLLTIVVVEKKDGIREEMDRIMHLSASLPYQISILYLISMKYYQIFKS